jgi:hypothetical protein
MADKIRCPYCLRAGTVDPVAPKGVTLPPLPLPWRNFFRLVFNAKACEICGEEVASLVLDHDHRNGLPRGMLCTSCNVRLGRIERGYSRPTQGDRAYLARAAALREAWFTPPQSDPIDWEGIELVAGEANQISLMLNGRTLTRWMDA